MMRVDATPAEGTMKKHAAYWLIGVAAVVAILLTGVPLLANTDNGGEKMPTNNTIPPIDANRPAVTETATFSLG